MAKLAKVPLPRLCPVGFVFIWVDKLLISPVVKQMSRWGYVYIENLTWVFMHANNTILRLPSACAQRSHLTLFLFRKEGEPLEPHPSAPVSTCTFLFQRGQTAVAGDRISKKCPVPHAVYRTQGVDKGQWSQDKARTSS